MRSISSIMRTKGIWRRGGLVWLAAILLAMAALSTTPAGAAHPYVMTDIQTLSALDGQATAINNFDGEIVGYYRSDADFHNHAFLYSGGSMTDLGAMDDAANDSAAYGINNQGQITGQSNGHAFLYEASGGGGGGGGDGGPYSRYDFTFYYYNGSASGDNYSGYVYAPTGYDGYKVGQWKTITDENGQTGYYEITAVTDLGSDGSKSGQVYIINYHDAETGQDFTPVSHGTPVGTWLGSEHDFIVQAGGKEGYFGGGYYEADAGSTSRYDFKYYYNNGSGDYYVGYVYAPCIMPVKQYV